MKTHITGLVLLEKQEEYPCANFQNLTFKVYQVTLSSEKLLQAFALEENGFFKGEFDTEKNTTLMARLYLKTNPEKEILISESGPHCPKRGSVYVEFKYDPSKFGSPLYTSMKTSVTAQLGKLKLKDLKEDQINQLLCIACVSRKSLDRLISAGRLFDNLKINIANCVKKIELAIKQKSPESAYLKVALTNIKKLSNESISESIFFALLRDDNSLELNQILTLSTEQLKQKIHQAIADNIIAPIPNEPIIIDAFIALRNCMLFNSNYDQYFYDAKLIHQTSLDLKSKSILLDKTIEAGSLLGVMAEEDIFMSGNSIMPRNNRDEIEAIIELDGHLKNFPPLLDLTVTEIRDKKAGPLKTISISDVSPLSGKTKKDWEEIIIKIPSEPQYPDIFITIADPIQNYSWDIEDSLSNKFPTSAVIARMGEINSGGFPADFNLPLTGYQEVPPNVSTAIGSVTGTYNDITHTLNLKLSFTGLLAPATVAHLHGPSAKGVVAPVQINLAGFPAGVTTGTYSNTYTLTQSQHQQFIDGLWYIDIHSSLFPGGEIRTQLEPVRFPAESNFSLSGDQEVPPNPSTALGALNVYYNPSPMGLQFNIYFSGLSSPTTAAHFHGPAPIGANGPVQINIVRFPVGVLSGYYHDPHDIILTPAQEADLLAGLWYIDIHTTGYPGGEIRAQLKIVSKFNIKTILEKNLDFDIAKQAAHTWFKVVPNPEAPNEISAEALTKIQELQRCIKLTEGVNKFHQAQALMSSGITSAYQIYSMGKFEFRNAMSRYALSAKEITFMLCRAKTIYDSLNFLAVQHIRYDSSQALVPSSIQYGSVVDASPLQIPDMETIFGSLNTCSCTDCQSVYSAAAYLADLLHWTKSDIVCADTGVNAYGVLNEPSTKPRRPDISRIFLNCKNTNTLVPYIDLVNEILSINLLTAPDYKLLQTTKDTSELLLRPENRFDSAELLLQSAYFPWNLPYDGKWDEALKYIKEMGIRYDELINSFSRQDEQYNNINWAITYLDLNKIEFLLLITNNYTELNFWKKYWGIENTSIDPVTDSPKNIGPVLKNAELELEELKELLQSSYITGSSSTANHTIIVKKPLVDDCNIDKYTFSSPFVKAIAENFMKFLRLKRKCGLSVWELDLAIRNLGGIIDQGFIIKLSSCLSFCEEYNISFPDLMLWFNANTYQDLLSTAFTPTPYFKDKFQNELFSEDTRNFFTPNAPGNCFVIPIISLTSSQKQILGSILGIENFELDLIRDYLMTLFIPDLDLSALLTYVNLSYFDKYAKFSKVMGIEISEMIKLFESTDTILSIPDPISSGLPIPNALWSFSYHWDVFKKFNLKPSEFRDLVLGEDYYKLDSAGLADDAKKLWSKINDDVNIIKASFPDAYDPANNLLLNFPDAPILSTIVYQDLADKFDMGVMPLVKIIENYLNTWVTSILANISDWGTIKEDFIIVYRLVKRISVLLKSTGMNSFGLQSGIKIEIEKSLHVPFYTSFSPDPLDPLIPTTPFYWLNNNFSILEISHFLWIKKATLQAYDLLIPQNKYFEHINKLFKIPSTFTIKEFYDSIGEKSEFKKLSEFEFESIFLKAKSITVNTKDLVSVMESFNSILGSKKIIGIGIDEIWKWVWNTTAGGVLIPAVLTNTDDLRRVLHSRYESPDAWSKFILPIQNGFRDRLRDALVGYYIGVGGFKDSNAIYDHFLFDSEMAPCMKTSRVVFAISAIQLLIHRTLTGLEPDICMDEDDKNEWEWRKNYRVWEANRKVFLYPENWIEPSLRLNKSPFFKEAEDLLLQDEVNDQNCEKAFSGYLTHLNEVARLDIRGTYIETSNPPADLTPDPPIVHVFARTWNAPYIYYYRKRENNVWSAWEKLELDIEGDHIIPIIFNRRLYLIWPMFIEKEHKTIKSFINGVEQNASYYEIKMCYSKLEFGKWTNKKILDGTILAGQFSGPGVFNNLEAKLGKGSPDWKEISVDNPDYNPILWRQFEGSIPNSPHAKYKLIWVPANINRGNMVLDNPTYQDFSYVSLDKQSFYFWGELNKVTGDLIIHCRRDFGPEWKRLELGYTQMAYEDGFKISACNEKVEIIRAAPAEGFRDIRFLARPYNTQPNAMLLKQGLNHEGPLNGMFVKKTRTYFPDSVELFKNTNTSYTLTYPHQYKDALWNAPFFFSDKKHTFFIERKKDRKCICNILSLPTIRPVTGPVSTLGSVTTPGTIIVSEIGTTSSPVSTGPVSKSGQLKSPEFVGTPGPVLLPAEKCEYQYIYSNKFIVWSHEHLYSCTMLAEFNRYGIRGLLDSKNPNIRRQQRVENYFNNEYGYGLTYVSAPVPNNEYDFDRDGAYSIYNWEIFFHLVSVVGKQLRQNNKFAEAKKWLEYVFDPTNREGALGLQRVWKINPFMKDVSNGSIQYMMRLLSSGGLTQAEEMKKAELTAQIDEWRNNAFDPHRIASMRPRTYMLWTIMEYIDTLTDWGDWLFRQDTMESINEASNLYILAAKLLGDRPEKIPKVNTNDNFSFSDISSGLDPFSNAAVQMENQMTGMTFSSNCACESNPYRSSSGFSLPNLLFCIPDNPKLIEYWNRVEDRLFKIRHCMNIDGQVRELALFQPPIDPALLVRAKAMGLDISEVLSDLASPSPHYRFSYLLQKAADFCNEVKSLGGQLLSAFEKTDAEELSLIRQLHEQNILKASRNLKKLQIEEAKQTLKSLEHAKKLIEIRLNDYESRAFISSQEQHTIDKTRVSEGFMYAEQGLNAVSGFMVAVPDLFVGAPTASGAVVFGGQKLYKAIQASASIVGIIATINRNQASMSATYASYQRRDEDRLLQIKTATEELNQNAVQILGAEIRIAITEKELENHDLQAEQSKEIFDWMKSKFTNHDLYSWMSGELRKLHRKAYVLAYDMAKLAQRAFEKELTGTNPQIIEFGNWDSAKKGLLAGDRLSVQLKELESNYMKLNKREFELTKSISVKLLNPQALVNLIKDGTCNIELPEWIFNLEYEDEKLYAMRLKSIAVSVPCITGPQTSTNVKLKMLKSWIGWKDSDRPIPADLSNMPSISEEIITSSSVNDPAVFEMNLRDERYMPFENRGVVSNWVISLPNQHEFDYSTISDLVLHIRYVAKGSNISIPSTDPPNLALKYTHQFMSLKHDYTMDWQRISAKTVQSSDPFTTLSASDFIPALETQFIPYRMRLARVTTGVIKTLYFLYKDEDDKIKVKEITDSSSQEIIIANSKIFINNHTIEEPDDIKIEDIWILYEYTIPVV